MFLMKSVFGPVQTSPRRQVLVSRLGFTFFSEIYKCSGFCSLNSLNFGGCPQKLKKRVQQSSKVYQKSAKKWKKCACAGSKDRVSP